MIKDFDDLMVVKHVKDWIDRQGAEGFLKSVAYLYPETAKQLAQAILADHTRDYDKKKAALLKGK